ncbi:MAG: alpha/beta hydrolase [Oscillospiraceae bacterium]|nr:alpha/beta hydrolase [Oscillospiraceae bacterium]MBQ5340792.1 alpha/beta hydrolase [Oscillospiraceae bacterium]MBQ5343126.1 alpha/beta hydrolase [Oscillospiraceae bacterium]
MIQHVNGIDLFYEVKGTGDPLLMVHGNSEDHTIFDEAAEVLKDRFTVYLVDSRDHGQSTKVSDLHYSDMADDLLVFLNDLDLQNVTFYGFSDGGILGLLLAQKTDRISRLIVSGANMTPDGVKGSLKILVKFLYFFSKDSKLKMMLNEPHITAEELSSIKVPTTVIAGEKDLVRQKETEAIAAAIPGSKLRILKGEGHGSYIVHKTAIADLILEETAKN